MVEAGFFRVPGFGISLFLAAIRRLRLNRGMRPTPSPVRNIVLPLLLLLFSISGLKADPVEDKVKEIRARYGEIEGAKLRTRAIEFESQDEPLSGTCTLFFQGDEIVKVFLSYGAGDHGASDEYYYYKGGELFFVYASDGYWRFTGETLSNGESETIDSAVEHRVYIDQGRIIRHLSKEATSKNPAALKGLLAKAENRPSADADRAGWLLRRGLRAHTIRSAGDAIRALVADE